MARKKLPTPPSSLEATYEAATHRARRRLASRYDLENLALESPDYPGRPLVASSPSPEAPKAQCKAKTVDQPSDDFLRGRWREVWRIDIEAELKSRCGQDEPDSGTSVKSLLIAIPQCFADKLPAVYLSHDDFERVFPIPHLDRNRLICTFDSAEVIPYSDDPAGIVREVVERGITLLIDGMSGADHSDFEEEFASYWAQECGGNRVISLVDIGDGAKEIWSFSVGKWKLWGASHLLAQSREEAARFLGAVGVAAKDKDPAGKGRRAFYLPLPHFGRPPFPTNNREIWQRLGEVSPRHQAQLLRFLVKAPRPCAVLFSVPSDEGRTLGLWWHLKWDVGEEKAGGRAGRRQAASVPGFRPNVASVSQELKRVAAHQLVERATVERLDTQRLQVRTIGEAPKTLARSFNVIGCGSLGSQLAASLAASGEVGEMALFDPQLLAVENVPRHLCSLPAVGHFKTEAVAQEIARRSPLLRFQNHSRDVLDVLRDKPEVLQKADLSLVALGDFAVERRLNRLAFQQPELFSPLCFVWVEPMALAGHALWFPQREKANPQPCFECAFDEHLLLPQRIVDDPLQFSRREAGCQTTFVPYGGPNLAALLAALTRWLLQCLDQKPTQPLLWSWAGDLEMAQEQNIKILNPSQLRPFSSGIQVLQFSSSCPLCGAAK